MPSSVSLSGRARNIAHARRERGENRIEMLDDLVLAANHHAITSLQTPHPSAGAHIHIVDLARSEFLRAPDIVDVIGIAAVDQDVSRFEVRQKFSDRFVDNRSRHHQPDCARLRKLLRKVCQGSVPVALSVTSSLTACGDLSNTTQL